MAGLGATCHGRRPYPVVDGDAPPEGILRYVLLSGHPGLCRGEARVVLIVVVVVDVVVLSTCGNLFVIVGVVN